MTDRQKRAQELKATAISRMKRGTKPQLQDARTAKEVGKLGGEGGVFNDAPKGKGMKFNLGLGVNRSDNGRQGQSFQRFVTNGYEYHVYHDPNSGKRSVVRGKKIEGEAAQKKLIERTQAAATPDAQKAQLNELAKALAAQISSKGGKVGGIDLGKHLKAQRGVGGQEGDLAKMIQDRLRASRVTKTPAAGQGMGGSQEQLQALLEKKKQQAAA